MVGAVHEISVVFFLFGGAHSRFAFPPSFKLGVAILALDNRI